MSTYGPRPVDPTPADPAEPSLLPTKKWWGLVVTGLATIAANWIVSGAFDDVERGMSATLLVGAATAYFKSNDSTGFGGVPAKK